MTIVSNAPLGARLWPRAERHRQAPFSFAAGPAAIPRPVLEQVQAELLNYANKGFSVMELSHRSEDFEAIMTCA